MDNKEPEQNQEEEKHAHFAPPTKKIGEDQNPKAQEKHWHRKSIERGRHEHSGRK